MLNKWRDSLRDLLNPSDKTVNQCEELVITGISAKNIMRLNDQISVEEDQGAMKAMNKIKAYGEDGLSRRGA